MCLKTAVLYRGEWSNQLVITWFIWGGIDFNKRLLVSLKDRDITFLGFFNRPNTAII